MPERRLIDTPAALGRALESLRGGHGPVAVDTERASGYRYSQRAYLIQIYRRGSDTLLIDPPALGPLTELNELIADEEWVLHAASQDLACLRDAGLHPTTIFDTELGGRLLNLPKVGLGTMVEELLGVRLKKEHSAADWSTRPLPTSWLEYAALDVELLIDLRDTVEQRLTDEGKTTIAAEEFQAELDKPPAPAPAEPWRRLSKIHTIRDRRQLAVARSLWLARDEFARSIDTAPGRLVPDRSLVAAAKASLSSQRELARLKEFTGRASRSELKRWWHAVETGLSADLPELRPARNDLPHPRSWSEKHPEASARLRSAKDAVAALADEHNVPAENLVTPRFVRQLAWDPPQPPSTPALHEALAGLGARAWQCNLVAPALHQAFVEADQDQHG